MSSSKVFFINPLAVIKEELQQEDEISIYKNIYDNLELFSCQLASITYNLSRNKDNRYIESDKAILEDRTTNFSNKIV